jgi:hypothetical protein
MIPVRRQALRRVTPGADVAQALQALAQPDPARERTPPGQPAPRVPIPAQRGTADWGAVADAGEV